MKNSSTALIAIEPAPPVRGETPEEIARLQALDDELQRRLEIIDRAGCLTGEDFTMRINAIG